MGKRKQGKLNTRQHATLVATKASKSIARNINATVVILLQDHKNEQNPYT